MDEEQIQEQIDNVVSTSPTATAARAKRKITYERVPMDAAIASMPSPSGEATPAPESLQNPNEGSLANTTRHAPGETATQHVDNGFPESVKLSSSGEAYIGGSVRPNSTVRASLRPMDRYARDPFWLESTDRFAPVEPWTVKLAVLNEPAKLNTFDVDKAAYYLAKNYQGVPEEDFFGYEYTPLSDYKETWWSSFWDSYLRNLTNQLANTQSAVVGSVSQEEAAKTADQRAQDNREANGYFFNFIRRKGQEYLDYLNQLEPIPRGRGAEVAAVFGSATESMTPSIIGIPFGPAGWVLGGAGSALMSAVETLQTRDAVLEDGGTVGEAQRAQWKHMGTIGVTEIVSNLIGQGVVSGVMKAAINRGASRALTEVFGVATELGFAHPLGGVTEVYQDKFGNIIAGRAGYETLWGMTRDEWNTFYGTMLVGAFSSAGAAIEGAKMHNKTTAVSDDYVALVSQLKKGLVDKAAQRGYTISKEQLAKIDDLAMRIYQDPEGVLDADMRAVAQGFYDKLQNLPPEAIEQARQLQPEQLKGLSEDAFKDLDKRAKATPGWNLLSPAEQQVALGEIRAGAYIGALWFGQSPSEFKIPNIIDAQTDGAAGFFGTPEIVENTIDAYDQETNDEYYILENAALEGIETEFNGVPVNELSDAINDEVTEYIASLGGVGEPVYTYAKDSKQRTVARDLLANKVPDEFDNFKKVAERAISWQLAKPKEPANVVGIANSVVDNGSSPYDTFVVNQAYGKSETTLSLERLESVLHEFSHANDWNMTDKEISNLAEFVKWYTNAIRAVFGRRRGDDVEGGLRSTYREQWKAQEGYDTFLMKPASRVDYNSVFNSTENRAQAVGRLLEDAKEYIGLTGKPAQFIQAANAILRGLNDTTPLPDGLSDYVEALKGYVKKNSDVIKRIRGKVPANRMKAAIQSYMGGNEDINWQGVTPMTLAEFGEAVQLPLDADALQYVVDSLDNIRADDFVEKAAADWDRVWDKFYKDDPEAARIRDIKKQKVEAKADAMPVATETDVITNERETDVDGGIDPEKAEGVGVEDWDTDSGLMLSKRGSADDDPLAALIAEATKEGSSEFKKKINRRFNGRDLPNSMKLFKDALENHEYKPFGARLDFMRGIPSFLSALGGEALVNQFDLVGRYDDYSNKVLEANEKLVQALLPLFDGSRLKYEDYVRQTGVRKYEIDYKDPYSQQKRLVSKRELMSGLLYFEQPDSSTRIAKAVNEEQIKKYLDEQDIKFAHMLRQYLSDEYRFMKGEDANVPKNYWPIIDQRSLERGDERIINDMGRKETDAPIGLLDVMAVIGSYQSRAAGTKSGYFAALRRINSIVDYDGRAAMTNHMSQEDLDLNDTLDKDSSEIRKMIRNRLGDYNYDRFISNVRDTITHRNDDALKDSLVSKIARSATTSLIYGKPKQFFINLAAITKWLGYEHNTYGGFMYGLFDALLHPVESIRIANQNPTIVNRAKFYRYNEYMEKNLSANSDNLVTYIANWATKHDVRSLEAMSDFVIHLGTWAKKVLGSFTVGGDYIANVFGYAASYKAALRALGSEEAAKKSLSNFINTRQSTTNQAVKGLMVRRANRQGFWGNIFAFTGENTQTVGSIAQDINRMITGDLSIEKGTRDVIAQVSSGLAYVAVQSGWLAGIIAMALGAADLSDDDWDKLYDNVFKELLGQIAGIAGPLTNAVAQPMLNLMVYGYDYNGLSIPGLAEVYNIVKGAKKGEIVPAVTRTASLFGIASGLNNALSSAGGIIDMATVKGRKNKNAAFWRAFGFSEGMSNRLAGTKKKK